MPITNLAGLAAGPWVIGTRVSVAEEEKIFPNPKPLSGLRGPAVFLI